MRTSCLNLKRRVGNRVKRDLAGVRFGRLVAIEVHTEEGHARWMCKCDCGQTKVVQRRSLLDGNTRSCGCLRIEMFADRKDGAPLRTSPLPRPARVFIEGHARAVGIDPTGDNTAEKKAWLEGIAFETTAEYARMESQGYRRTAADAFAPESERWERSEEGAHQ